MGSSFLSEVDNTSILRTGVRMTPVVRPTPRRQTVKSLICKPNDSRRGFTRAQGSVVGTKLPNRDVRSSVAIRGIADIEPAAPTKLDLWVRALIEPANQPDNRVSIDDLKRLGRGPSSVSAAARLSKVAEQARLREALETIPRCLPIAPLRSAREQQPSDFQAPFKATDISSIDFSIHRKNLLREPVCDSQSANISCDQGACFHRSRRSASSL
jgi:hypothetical protein